MVFINVLTKAKYYWSASNQKLTHTSSLVPLCLKCYLITLTMRISHLPRDQILYLIFNMLSWSEKSQLIKNKVLLTLHCVQLAKKKKVFNFGLTAAVYLFLCSARLWGHECDRCCDQLCADWHVSTSQGLLLRVRDTAHIVDSGYWGNSYTHTNRKTSYVHDPYSIYLHSGSSLVVYTQHLCCILSVVLYCNCYGVS